METPFTSIVKSFRDGFRASHENTKDNIENLDKLVTWLMGFAFASFTLLISKTELSKLQSNAIGTTVVFLAICLAAGILFRIFNFLSFHHYRLVSLFLDRSLSLDSESSMNTQAKPLVASKTKMDTVYLKLKSDFDIKPPLDFDAAMNFDDKAKEEWLNSLVNHYNEQIEWAKKSEARGLEYIIDTLAKGLSLPTEKSSNLIKGKNKAGLRFRRYSALSYLFVAIHILSFITALSIVTASFLCSTF